MRSLPLALVIPKSELRQKSDYIDCFGGTHTALMKNDPTTWMLVLHFIALPVEPLAYPRHDVTTDSSLRPPIRF